MQGDGMKKNRMTYLDMAKGIGILFMIVGHTISLGWQKDLIYSFHMPLFFVCSGMIHGLVKQLAGVERGCQKIGKTPALTGTCSVYGHDFMDLSCGGAV